MNNNDILKRLRYTFDFNDDKMIEIFALANCEVTRSQVSNWLKKEDDAQFEELIDIDLALFLNGFIIEKRGKRDGPSPIPEAHLTNNLILKKLRIALNLTSTDVVALFKLADKDLTETELSAFMRNPKQTKFRPFLDQYLRWFLEGIGKKFKGNV